MRAMSKMIVACASGVDTANDYGALPWVEE